MTTTNTPTIKPFRIQYEAGLSRKAPPKTDFYEYIVRNYSKEPTSEIRATEQLDQYIASKPNVERVSVIPSQFKATAHEYLLIHPNLSKLPQASKSPKPPRPDAGKPDTLMHFSESLMRGIGIIQGPQKDPVLTVRHADGKILNLQEIEAKLAPVIQEAQKHAEGNETQSRFAEQNRKMAVFHANANRTPALLRPHWNQQEQQRFEAMAEVLNPLIHSVAEAKKQASAKTELQFELD